MGEPEPAVPQPAPEVNETDPFRDDPNQKNRQTLKKTPPRVNVRKLQPIAAQPTPVERSIVKRTVHQQSPTRPAELVAPRQISQSAPAAKPMPMPKAARPAIRLEPSANRIYMTGSQQSQGPSTIRFR